MTNPFSPNTCIRKRMTFQTVSLLVLMCLAFATFATTCYYSLLRSEFDENLEKMWATKAGYFVASAQGGASHQPPLTIHAKDSNFRPTYYELWDREGKLVHRSESFKGIESGNPFGAPDLSLIQKGKGSLDSRILKDIGNFRIKSSPLKIGRDEYLFRTAREQSEIYERVTGLIETFMMLMAGFSVFAFFAANWLISRHLAPVEAVRKRAQEISAHRLHERLPVVNPDDEIGQLSTTLNRLLDRLEQSFETMKSFTSDASHELRTPLAAIRAVGEEILQRESANADELRDALCDILEETHRLTGLTDRLLAMARLDAHRSTSESETSFDLSERTRAIIEQLEVLASEKNQKLEVSLPESLLTLGDPILIQQALTNLIDNAIKYTPENGTIDIVGKAREGQVELSVRDNGPGIAREHHEKLFDRFYRVDQDRGRGQGHGHGGYGVGLSIARRAVELSRGSVTLESEPGKGSRFTVVLPAETA